MIKKEFKEQYRKDCAKQLTKVLNSRNKSKNMKNTIAKLSETEVDATDGHVRIFKNKVDSLPGRDAIFYLRSSLNDEENGIEKTLMMAGDKGVLLESFIGAMFDSDTLRELIQLLASLTEDSAWEIEKEKYEVYKGTATC